MQVTTSDYYEEQSEDNKIELDGCTLVFSEFTNQRFNFILMQDENKKHDEF